MAEIVEINADPHARADIEFRTPRLQRAFDLLFILAVSLGSAIVGSVFAFLALGPLMPRSWSVQTMIGVSAGIAFFAGLIIVLLLRVRPSRIALDERSLRARGWLYRRTLPYESIALVTVEKPENAIGRVCRVVARARQGRPLSIWLSRNDAEECFDILRRMCEHAPSIDLEEGVLAPENPEHRRQGLMIAGEEFRRRARWNATVFVFCALCSVSSITTVVKHYSSASASTSSRSITRRWFSAVFFPIAAGGAALSWRSNRRFAMELEEGAAGGGWTVGYADDDDED